MFHGDLVPKSFLTTLLLSIFPPVRALHDNLRTKALLLEAKNHDLTRRLAEAETPAPAPAPLITGAELAAELGIEFRSFYNLITRDEGELRGQYTRLGSGQATTVCFTPAQAGAVRAYFKRTIVTPEDGGWAMIGLDQLAAMSGVNSGTLSTLLRGGALKGTKTYVPDADGRLGKSRWVFTIDDLAHNLAALKLLPNSKHSADAVIPSQSVPAFINSAD